MRTSTLKENEALDADIKALAARIDVYSLKRRYNDAGQIFLVDCYPYCVPSQTW